METSSRSGRHAAARTDDRVLLGLIGAGILHSRSPAQHEGEAAAHHLRCQYRLVDLDALGLDADALPDLLRAAERFGFAGLNITFPCKQAVLPHLDRLSPDAAALGAVNTVVFADGRRVGHNTDWSGYADALRDGLPSVALDGVVLFGGGGAGAAVAYALLTMGVGRVTVVDTVAERGAALATQMTAIFGAGRIIAATAEETLLAEADGIVNATPIGMAKFPGAPFPLGWLRPRHWVSEVVYVPLETELLAAARRLGCRTLDGSGMNIRQAAAAFRLFTGLEADVARMRRHFESAAG